jgi:hypothetical protein
LNCKKCVEVPAETRGGRLKFPFFFETFYVGSKHCYRMSSIKPEDVRNLFITDNEITNPYISADSFFVVISRKAAGNYDPGSIFAAIYDTVDTPFNPLIKTQHHETGIDFRTFSAA